MANTNTPDNQYTVMNPYCCTLFGLGLLPMDVAVLVARYMHLIYLEYEPHDRDNSILKLTSYLYFITPIIILVQEKVSILVLNGDPYVEIGEIMFTYCLHIVYC